MNLAQNYDAVSLEDLEEFRFRMKFAALNVRQLLAELCEGVELAEREIRLALDLPVKVLLRRAQQAFDVASANGSPSRADLAAYLARIMATVEGMDAAIERKQSGAALQ